ncbi:putative salivary gland protein 9 [Frankliniella occidentalis]|nr:putative salivary gland protein 9 [Frankliniella occidentalis]
MSAVYTMFYLQNGVRRSPSHLCGLQVTGRHKGQSEHTGRIVKVQCLDGGKIFYLVTKKHHTDLPTLWPIRQSLLVLRDLCLKYNVNDVATPVLATGLDQQKWDGLWQSLEEETLENIFAAEAKLMDGSWDGRASDTECASSSVDTAGAGRLSGEAEPSGASQVGPQGVREGSGREGELTPWQPGVCGTKIRKSLRKSPIITSPFMWECEWKRQKQMDAEVCAFVEAHPAALEDPLVPERPFMGAGPIIPSCTVLLVPMR